MVQIIKGPESQSTIRQRALNESLSGAIGAWDQMERTQKQDALTQRQQALEVMKIRDDFQKKGLNVSEEDVKQSLAPDKVPSFGEKLKQTFMGIEPEKQVRPDLYAAPRTTEWIQKQADAKAEKEFNNKVKNVELETKEYSLKELKDMSPAKKRKMELENQKAQNDTSLFDLNKQKLMADVAKTQAESAKVAREASQTTSGKQLSSTDVLKVNEGNAIPTMLKDVSSIIANNSDSFGPIRGRASSFNPYNEKAQTIESNIRASAQAFGRYMEGGVLRKEDEEKYQKMFPNLSDTPEIAANKLAIVEKLLIDRQNSSVQALKSSGYDTKGVDQNLVSRPAPDILNINGGAKKAAPVVHPEANEALQWAKSNPNDPRSAAILQRLGV